MRLCGMMQNADFNETLYENYLLQNAAYLRKVILREYFKVS